MKIFTLSIALFSGITGMAQYDPVGAITMWTEGYVVTIQNDTIRGQVRVGSLANDSPASIFVRMADEKKIKLKGDDLRLIAQRLPNFAYSTGSIPRDRDMVVFERVPNPRRADKPMLLERLTPAGGRLAIFFDALGWKKTTEYTFGNFSLETSRQDLSYVAVKDNSESLLAKKGDMEAIHEKLFGDCPAFVRHYPTATRRDWNRFGEMVDAYNRLCSLAEKL